MIIRFIVKQRFLCLLIILLLVIAHDLMGGTSGKLRIIVGILFYSVFLSIVYSITKRKLITLILALLTTLTFGLNFINNIVFSPFLTVLSHFSGMVYFGFVIIIFLSYIFGERLVTRDTVYGAFVVYLLIGIFWSHIYFLLEFFYPGSLTTEKEFIPYKLFLVYSYENLNLGISGLLKPISGLAAFFSMLQGLIAQIYMVVQVAWLVHIYFSQKTSKRPQ